MLYSRTLLVIYFKYSSVGLMFINSFAHLIIYSFAQQIFPNISYVTGTVLSFMNKAGIVPVLIELMVFHLPSLY